MKRQTLLIIDSSENNADLYYRTRFFVPDPAIYIEHKGKQILVLSDLELDRGKTEARVDVVVALSEYKKMLPVKKRPKSSLTDIAGLVFKELKVKGVVVPGSFPIKYADELRRLGYEVDYKRKEY